MPKIHVDPFLLRLPLVNGKIADPSPVFETISALPMDFPVPGQKHEDDSRWFLVEDGWIVIDYLEEFGGKHPRWEGTMARVQTKDLGHLVGAKGSTPLETQLKDGEGYSRHIAFVFDKRTHLLWLQRDRRIVGQTYFGDYLRDVANTSIKMRVQLREDAIERALKLAVVKFVDFGFYPKRGDPKNLDDFLAATDQFGDVRVDIKISAGRNRSLPDRIRGLMKRVGKQVESGSELVETAKVGGRFSEDDREGLVIDLFHDRLDLSKEISDERTRKPDRLVAAVRDVWSKHRDDVKPEGGS